MDHKEPTAKQILQARKNANLTQSQAAGLIYKTLRNWQKYESGEIHMDRALWELFKIKTSTL